MKEKLTNNFPLKIISVLIAVLVWLLVVNIDNPIITRYFKVPVQVQNEAYIERTGKMCLIPEGQDTTTVAVTGNRKTVEKLTETDIVATADLTQAVSLQTTPVMVPISVTCKGISSTAIKTTPQNLGVILEDMQTEEFIISVNTGDSQPGKGYELGTCQSNPEKIRITGPKSLVSKIDKVVAPVNISGITEDIEQQVDLKIIDKNQEELSESQMEYLKYDINKPSVVVSVDLWNVRSNVQIKSDYTGEPAEGYQVESLSMTPSTVSVAGTDAALSDLAAKGNIITIPADIIDVSGHDSDFETKVNIDKVLPDDLKLTTGTSDTVLVKVNILPKGSKVITIPTQDIIKKPEPDGPEGLEVVFETDKIEIRVQEDQKSLDALNEADIKASVNLEGMTEGSYEVPVEIQLPEGYQLVSEVSTEVKLIKITDTAEEE